MNVKDLEKLDLGHSPLTDNIFVGVLNKAKNIWKYKRDITNGFLMCVIQRWENKSEVIKSGTDEWEVSVRKLPTKKAEPLFYIQNTKAGYLGNAIMFWGKNRSGYTANLEDAGQYSYEEAKQLCQGNPEKNKAWPVEYIEMNAVRVTDHQYLKSSHIKNFE